MTAVISHQRQNNTPSWLHNTVVFLLLPTADTKKSAAQVLHCPYALLANEHDVFMGGRLSDKWQVAMAAVVSLPRVQITCRGMEDPHGSEAAAVALEAGLQLLERSQGEQKLAQSGLLLQSMKCLHSHSATG